jgi:hypothetical protein
LFFLFLFFSFVFIWNCIKHPLFFIFIRFIFYHSKVNHLIVLKNHRQRRFKKEKFFFKQWFQQGFQ